LGLGCGKYEERLLAGTPICGTPPSGGFMRSAVALTQLSFALACSKLAPPLGYPAEAAAVIVKHISDHLAVTVTEM